MRVSLVVLISLLVLVGAKADALQCEVAGWIGFVGQSSSNPEEGTDRGLVAIENGSSAITVYRMRNKGSGFTFGYQADPTARNSLNQPWGEDVDWLGKALWCAQVRTKPLVSWLDLSSIPHPKGPGKDDTCVCLRGQLSRGEAIQETAKAVEASQKAALAASVHAVRAETTRSLGLHLMHIQAQLKYLSESLVGVSREEIGEERIRGVEAQIAILESELKSVRSSLSAQTDGPAE